MARLQNLYQACATLAVLSSAAPCFSADPPNHVCIVVAQSDDAGIPSSSLGPNGLIEALADSDEFIRKSAEETLIDDRSAECSEALLTAARHEHALIRRKAIELLAKRGHPRVIPVGVAGIQLWERRPRAI